MKGFLDHLTRSKLTNGWIFGWILVLSAASLVAATALSIDALELAANPQAKLSCNLNAVVSCGTVATA